MKYVKVIVFLFFSVIIGCQSSKPVFNRDSDVPEDPRLTVIPSNEFKTETDFAGEVEEYIMQLGFRLMRRPGLKAVETNTQAAQTKHDEEKAVGIAGSKTERYYSLQETQADYVIETIAEGRRVKVIRTSTTEVLGLLELNNRNNSYDKPSEQIREVLEGIGLSRKSELRGRNVREFERDTPQAQASSSSVSEIKMDIPNSRSSRSSISEVDRRNMFNSLLEPGYKEYKDPIKAKITFVGGLTKEVYIFAEDNSSYMLGSSPTPADFMKTKKENVKEVVKH